MINRRRHYTYPPETQLVILRAQAKRRRDALTAHGCATYTLGQRGGVAAIVCLCCGMGSSHPKDIEQKYCGFCRTLHSEWDDSDANA